MRSIGIIGSLVILNYLNARLLPPETTDVEKSISECLMEIISRYVRKDFPLVVQTPATWYDRLRNMRGYSRKQTYGDGILESLHKSNNISLVVPGEEYLSKSRKLRALPAFRSGSFLLILTGIGEHKDILQFGELMLLRNHIDMRSRRAPLIIITDNQKAALRLLQIASNTGTTDAIALVVESHDKVQYIDVLLWLPSDQKDLCGLGVNKFKLMDRWSFLHRSFVVNYYNLFPPKRFADIKNCKLGVKISSDRFSLALGYWVFYKIVNMYVKTGPSDKTHMAMPQPYNTHGASEDCVMTYPFYREEITWYVPPGATVPRWQSLFKAFTPPVWILTVLVFILGSIITYLLGNRYEDQSFEVSVMNAVLSHLSMSIVSKLKGFFAAFFIVWFFYCLHINTSYQGALFGFLVEPGQDAPIKTLEELTKSGLQMEIFTSFEDYGLIGNLFKNFSVCPYGIRGCFERIHTQRDRAILSTRRIANIFALHRHSHDRKPFIVPLVENVDYVYLGIAYKPAMGCILHTYIDNLMKRLLTGGIIAHHQSELDMKAARMKKNQILDVDLAFPLSLSHLEGGFFLLVFGLLIAIFVFVCEMVWYMLSIHFVSFQL